MINKTFYSIFQKGSRTYFYSSLFFPADIKRDVFELYAFVRKTDNFVDRIPQDSKGFYDFKNKYKMAISGKKTGDIVIDTFVKLAERKNIKDEWIQAFFDSMELDLTKRRYESLDETLKYIYGSAEVIGLMMANILGLKKEAYSYARNLGTAMQYINFIRDIDEDLKFDRIYFPETDLEEFGLKSLEKNYTNNYKMEFKGFINKQLFRYCKWQNIAEEGYKLIPKKYLISVKTASDMYNWTAQQIYDDPFIIYSWKVKPKIRRIIKTTVANLIDPNRPMYQDLTCKANLGRPQSIR